MYQRRRSQPGPITIAQQSPAGIAHHGLRHASTATHPELAHGDHSGHDKIGDWAKARQSHTLLRSDIVAICTDPDSTQSLDAQLIGDVQ